MWYIKLVTFAIDAPACWLTSAAYTCTVRSVSSYCHHSKQKNNFHESSGHCFVRMRRQLSGVDRSRSAQFLATSFSGILGESASDGLELRFYTRRKWPRSHLGTNDAPGICTPTCSLKLQQLSRTIIIIILYYSAFDRVYTVRVSQTSHGNFLLWATDGYCDLIGAPKTEIRYKVRTLHTHDGSHI